MNDYNSLALVILLSFFILFPIIPETNSKHLRLDIKLIQKRFNFLNRYHILFFSHRKDTKKRGKNKIKCEHF